MLKQRSLIHPSPCNSMLRFFHLRDYISSKGGNVVMITTFGHGSFGKLKDIRIDNDYKSKLQQAGITDQDLRIYGIASEIGCLTISEAAKLNRMVNRKRERQTSTVLERFSGLHQKQSSVPSMAKELPENEGRMQVSLPHPVSQHLPMRR